jgi:Zn finger protein HypA/HybF involved in hydrogenase expression
VAPGPRNTSLEATLTCLECGEESEDGRGWQAFVDEELELLVYCPACAAREVGD